MKISNRSLKAAAFLKVGSLLNFKAEFLPVSNAVILLVVSM